MLVLIGGEALARSGAGYQTFTPSKEVLLSTGFSVIAIVGVLAALLLAFAPDRAPNLGELLHADQGTNSDRSVSMERRTFLKACAVGGIGVGFGGFYDTLFHLVPFNDRGRKALHRVYGNSDSPEWLRDPASGKLAPNPDWTLRHTVDQQCHSECGLRVKINRKSGRVERIFGNPYHPHSLTDYAGPDAPLLATAALPGTVCARGNAGIQTAYDPYRITVPLKRKGARGSGQWPPIAWEQLIAEVTDGEKIFADTGDPASKDIEVLGFKGLHAKRSEPMDPNAPELGHRTNGYVFQGGRIVEPARLRPPLRPGPRQRQHLRARQCLRG